MKPALKTGLTLLAGLGLGCGLTLGVQWGQQEWAKRTIAEANRAPALRSPLMIKGEPTLGSADAPVTIVEFSDFQCPYCKRFHDEVFAQLKRQYIDKGLVRFVHKDLPLPFHEQARPAAIAARCSAEQGDYWTTYEALFSKQHCLECLGADGIASAAGVNRTKLLRCQKEGRAEKTVTANLSEAELQGIRATPTFVIGPSQGGQHTGQVVEGAMPFQSFQQAIEASLHKSQQR